MNCPECGPVVHQPIPEDEAHCDCSGGWEWDYAADEPTGRPCNCNCHCDKSEVVS